MTRRFRGATYRIEVIAGAAKREMQVDGRPIEGALIPAFADGGEHDVVVRLAKDDASVRGDRDGLADGRAPRGARAESAASSRTTQAPSRGSIATASKRSRTPRGRAEDPPPPAGSSHPPSSSRSRAGAAGREARR